MSYKSLRPSIQKTAYVPLLGGSGPDIVQDLDLSKGHLDDWD
jgi:hypothetical protein